MLPGNVVFVLFIHSNLSSLAVPVVYPCTSLGEDKMSARYLLSEMGGFVNALLQPVVTPRLTDAMADKGMQFLDLKFAIVA